MNKEEINSLTWKYFWNQKVKETIIPLLYLLIGYLIIVGFPAAIGNFLVGTGVASCGYFEIIQECNDTMFFQIGLIVIMFTYIILVIFKFLLMLPIYWIKSNWKKAKDRARKELREVKK